jgi:heme-degrading monooxygenase HmoA
MIAVIFEVIPATGKRVEYLDIAARLKFELIKIEGFISIERFQSLIDPEKILSLSFWETEDSVRAWRNTEMHRAAQTIGRSGVFADYRLRVAYVERDYGMSNRTEVPPDSRDFHQISEEKQ